MPGYLEFIEGFASFHLSVGSVCSVAFDLLRMSPKLLSSLSLWFK